MAEAILPSPAGLKAEDLSDGIVVLRWTYAVDFRAQTIVFDVYAASDPLEPFRSLVAGDVNDLTTKVSGFAKGGVFYFSVVAKRSPLLSLPSRVLPFTIQAVALPVESAPAPPAATGSPSGISFPFGVSPLGSIAAEGGSPLLRGKLLQLLLTSPGERVNLPDFGTRLRDLIFDPNADVLAASTEFMIQRAIQKYMGDEIRVEQVAISVNDNALQVNIVYLRKSDLQFERVRVGVPLPG